MFENALTNCYVVYRKFHELHERKHLSHYEFIRKIGLAWLKPSAYWQSQATSTKRGEGKSTRKVSDENTSVSVDTCTVAESVVARRKILFTKKNSTMTANALDPYSGYLRCRLDHNLNHLPIRNDKPENNCQLHYWATKQKVRAQLMKCGTCNVTLCISCYKLFHESAQLKPNKVN